MKIVGIGDVIGMHMFAPFDKACIGTHTVISPVSAVGSGPSMPGHFDAGGPTGIVVGTTVVGPGAVHNFA